MNKESKFAKTIRYVSNVCIIVIPIFVIFYFWWFQHTQLFIFFRSYEAILYGCDLILWIGFLFTFGAFIARKRIVLGIIFFLITIPCLSISTLGLIGHSPSTSFFSDLPILYDHAQLDENSYYLTSEGGEWGLHYLYLYICENQSFYCEPMSLGRDHGGHLIVDAPDKEINIVDDMNGLIYTYGQQSRSYEEYSRTQFGNHLYYVSEGCNTWANDYHDSCGTYIYSLYECNLNNISCNRLPFQYIGEDGYSNLQVDDSAKEINFYLEPYPYNDPGILIYTYSSHPRCYVNGCTITSEQK
jgi:hypothetical protein